MLSDRTLVNPLVRACGSYPSFTNKEKGMSYKLAPAEAVLVVGDNTNNGGNLESLPFKTFIPFKFVIQEEPIWPSAK
jgi:hypothetical protein